MSPRPKRSARRSACPVARTLDLLGDRWTLLVVRDLLAGKARFRDLSASPERIASNILAERLERLQAGRIVEARASTHRAGSDEYHLTPRGRSLLPILTALRDWGLTNLPGMEARVRVKPR